MSAPLAGKRVLDLSRLLPGPYCTLILADLGAEVLKVEDTRGGDYLRLIPPMSDGGVSGAFSALNRGKRSIALDLKTDRGRELLLDLVPRFDVLVESFRPGVLARLGLDFETLKQKNPKLVLCSISGYGQDGPLEQRAGHDINYLALAGVLSTTGPRDGAPVVPGVQIADIAGGAMWAAIRILAELGRGEQREAVHLDVSMTEGAMAFLVPWFGDMAAGGAGVTRGEATLNGGAACYGVYPTADGFMSVGSLEPKFWIGLNAALGREADMSDPVAPPERQAEIRADIAQRLGDKTRDEWAETLAVADACVEPVLEMSEVPDHPQHVARAAFYDTPGRDGQTHKIPRLPVGATRATSAAPAQGEHTEAVLREELGLDDDALAALRSAKVIR